MRYLREKEERVQREQHNDRVDFGVRAGARAGRSIRQRGRAREGGGTAGGGGGALTPVRRDGRRAGARLERERRVGFSLRLCGELRWNLEHVRFRSPKLKPAPAVATCVQASDKRRN